MCHCSHSIARLRSERSSLIAQTYSIRAPGNYPWPRVRTSYRYLEPWMSGMCSADHLKVTEYFLKSYREMVELSTGDDLFKPKGEDGSSRDISHLAQMIVRTGQEFGELPDAQRNKAFQGIVLSRRYDSDVLADKTAPP